MRLICMEKDLTEEFRESVSFTVWLISLRTMVTTSRTFLKLKALMSPTLVTNLMMEGIMDLLQDAEILTETVVEFMSAYRVLAKVYSFDEYLRTILRDKFVCRLKDMKC